MKASGTVRADLMDTLLHATAVDAEQFRNLVVKLMSEPPKDGKADSLLVNLRLDASAYLESTEKGGKMVWRLTDPPILTAEHAFKHRSGAQLNTLKGIERFISWAELGHKPRDEDVYWIHEGIMEQYGTEDDNPRTGEKDLVRCGDPRMTTLIMSKLIRGAINELATKDIPKEVMDVIGVDMKKLWTAWYKWRYSQGDGDPLFAEESQMSWEEYQEAHPVCELCGLPGRLGNPLERMHMISAGADATVYEEAWTWLRAHHNHHRGEQHQQGWQKIFQLYPHIKPKYDRAQEKWNERRAKV
jgi:hypothetical protein